MHVDPSVPGLAQKVQASPAHRHFFISIIDDGACAERLNSGGGPGPGRESLQVEYNLEKV